MVLEAIKILVAFAASLAFVRLFFLHPECTWVRSGSCGINDGESAIQVLMQLLIVVSMLSIHVSVGALSLYTSRRDLRICGT